MLTAAYHFDVTELWVRADLLGQTFVLERDDYRCRLIFPADHDSFGMKGEYDGPLTGSASGTVDLPRQSVGVATVRVDVELDTEINADDIPPGGPVDEVKFKELQELMRLGADVARSIVSDLLKWTRVDHGQFWLDPQFTPPRVAWLTDLRDEQGRRLGTSYSDPFQASIGGHRNAIGSDQVTAILDAAAAGLEPSLSGQLLADASFHTLGPGTHNPNLAVLLAAISAEVGIKRFLMDHASEGQADLVDLILSNRMVSLAAASLYDHALKSTIGRSLRDDDRAAYKAVEALFKTRNDLAHRGKYSVTKQDAWTHVVSAARAAKYLDGL